MRLRNQFKNINLFCKCSGKELRSHSKIDTLYVLYNSYSFRIVYMILYKISLRKAKSKHVAGANVTRY